MLYLLVILSKGDLQRNYIYECFYLRETYIKATNICIPTVITII